MTTLMMVILEVSGMVALAKMGAAMAASIAVIGGAMGISKIGVEALEAVARQPEAAGDIRSNMIVSAALIEGLSFFAIIVALLVLFLL